MFYIIYLICYYYNMSINESIIKLIKKYQNNKPPLTPTRCKHYPTCSNYSIECYKKFNFFKASFLTIKRILFCTPLNKKHFDPVPLNKKEKEIYKQVDATAKLIINKYLLLQTKKYPFMEIDDYLLLIYEMTIENTLIYNINNDEYNLLNKEYLEEIGNNTYRYYLLDNYLINNINNNIIQDYPLFYHLIDNLKKMIKKNNINVKMSYKELKLYLDNYLMSDLKIKHSDTYSKYYNTEYILLKYNIKY